MRDLSNIDNWSSDEAGTDMGSEPNSSEVMQTSTKVKCVIFDCEGVLVDSEPLCCRALVDLFADYDIHLTFEQCLAHYQGGKVTEILSQACDRLGLNARMDDLEPRYREKLQARFQSELSPCKGVVELISLLKERGIEYCVISNSSREKIDTLLQLTQLTAHFAHRIFSAFDANSWKPDPDLLRYAAMNMGFSPNECLYIDDTAKGAEAGVKAGISTLHYRTNHYCNPSHRPEVKEINSFEQVAKLCL